MNGKKLACLGLTTVMALSLAACGGNKPAESAAAGLPDGWNDLPTAEAEVKDLDAAIGGDGVFTVAMECSYPPYNWSQPQQSDGAVPIKDAQEFANGYDIMTAQEICDAYGWKLEVVRLSWDGLIPAVQSGSVDAIIAGQSMTAERAEQVDFAGPYLYANIVAVTKADSAYADAKSVADLKGAKCTSQSGTIWYESCLPQIPENKIETAADTAPSMLMSLETGTVDVIVTDMPTATGALLAYPDMKVLDFSGTDGDFSFETDAAKKENVNIGISVKKGNEDLKNAINNVLVGKTAEDYNALMEKAVELQTKLSA